MDAIDAARLRDSAELRARLISITQSHQVYRTASPTWAAPSVPAYIEQEAGRGDGRERGAGAGLRRLIRFAPAWPSTGT